MNNLEKFVAQHLQNAITLKESVKALEENEWDSITVMMELNVQIGHIFTVMKDSQGIIEEGRQINNLGDEISDVKDGIGLVAPRVMLCAAHQAHMALRLIANEFEA